MTTTDSEDFRSAQKALRWFIDEIGESEWHSRRKKVVDYFNSLKAKPSAERPTVVNSSAASFDPIAVYSDWLSWYMYLIEAQTERLGCDDPNQSARIFYFFVLIGNSIDALKKMEGIEKRMRALFHENKNQPDSVFYELAVAILYHRNGWKVRFVEETSTKKTPDLEVTKGAKKYWVECKRLAKVNDYAEQERKEWMKRSMHLFNAMRLFEPNCFAEVIFKKPIEETELIILGAAFAAYINQEKLNDGSWLSNEYIDFKARRLNLDRINTELLESSTRPTAPLMLKLILEEYDIKGNYAYALQPSLLEIAHPDDQFAVLNEFYAGLKEVNIAKWDCIAKESLMKKAKDIKRNLSRALDQIPEEGEGIIHIGYETVTGPEVEAERYKKIDSTIRSFGFGNKIIAAIYCNAFQMRPGIYDYDCAETVLYYLREPVLTEPLLFNSHMASSSTGTHWNE